MSDMKLHQQLMKDNAYREWYEVQSKNYKRKCKLSFELFLKFLRQKYPQRKLTTATEILQLRKTQDKSDDNKIKHWFADRIPEFIQWLTSEYKGKDDKPLITDSAIASTSPIRGFFTFHRYPLQIRKGAIPEQEGTLGDHKFTREQLSKMAQVGDIKEKAVIYGGKDLGQRISDFQTLKRKLILAEIERAKIEKREVDYPIEFKILTKKEKIEACCHVMKETVDVLLAYWQTCPDSEYWFPNPNGGHITDAQLNYILRKLWSVAYNDPKILEKPVGIGEKSSGRIRWHGLRDFLISAMANANINEWAIKFMVGKKVSKDMKEYLSGLDKKALFKQVESRITLSGLTNMNHTELSMIKTEVDSLRQAMGVIAKFITKEMQTKEIGTTLRKKIMFLEKYAYYDEVIDLVRANLNVEPEDVAYEVEHRNDKTVVNVRSYRLNGKWYDIENLRIEKKTKP